MTFPATNLNFPALGCGTWAWGNQLLWHYQPQMDEELQQVFNYCVSQGITLFDTGDSYGTGRFKGRSEWLLGRFASQYRGPHQEQICLATKLAPYPWRLTPQSIFRAGEASAQRLGRPIDLVQLHWSTANYAPAQERALLQGLVRLQQEGVAKAIGLSNFGPQRLQWAHAYLGDRGVKIASLQVQYSLLCPEPVTSSPLRAWCHQWGIRLIAYSPLTLGLLTGKYAPGGPYPQGLRGILARQLLPHMPPLLATLTAIAKKHQKTLAQVALNWCLQKGTLPIPGARTLAQAQENYGAWGWSLEAGEIAELDQVAARLPRKMMQNIFQSR
jgi:pyridoxine 4-dehydrogenase